MSKKVIGIGPWGVINEKSIGISYNDAIKKYGDHRFTLNHVPERAKIKDENGNYPSPEFTDSTDWYLHTIFPEDTAMKVDEIYQRCFFQDIDIIPVSIGKTYPLGHSVQDVPYESKDYISSVCLVLTSKDAIHPVEILFDKIPDRLFIHGFDINSLLENGLNLTDFINDFPNLAKKFEEANIDSSCVTGTYEGTEYYSKTNEPDLSIEALDYILKAKPGEPEPTGLKM